MLPAMVAVPAPEIGTPWACAARSVRLPEAETEVPATPSPLKSTAAVMFAIDTGASTEPVSATVPAPSMVQPATRFAWTVSRPPGATEKYGAPDGKHRVAVETFTSVASPVSGSAEMATVPAPVMVLPSVFVAVRMSVLSAARLSTASTLAMRLQMAVTAPALMPAASTVTVAEAQVRDSRPSRRVASAVVLVPVYRPEVTMKVPNTPSVSTKLLNWPSVPSVVCAMPVALAVTRRPGFAMAMLIAFVTCACVLDEVTWFGPATQPAANHMA